MTCPNTTGKSQRSFTTLFSDDDLEAIQQEIELVDLAAIPDFVEAQLRDRGLEELPGPLEAN